MAHSDWFARYFIFFGNDENVLGDGMCSSH